MQKSVSIQQIERVPRHALQRALLLRFVADSALEEGVSCELVSGNPNFILERKSAGIQNPGNAGYETGFRA